MTRCNTILLKILSLAFIMMILGVLVFSFSGAGKDRNAKSIAIDGVPVKGTARNLTAKNRSLSATTGSKLVPIQIPDDAWPKKKPNDYRLEKVSDPLVALQIALSKNDQDSIDHYLNLVVELGDKAVPVLKQLIAGSKDRAAVKLYAYALSKIGTKAATTALIEAVNGIADKDVRYLIEGFVRGIKSRDGLSALLDGINANDAATAELCARVLGRSVDPETLTALTALSTNAAENVRTRALDVLRSLSASEHAPALQRLAMSHDSGVGQAAISALANQATEDSVQLLLNSFNQYPPLPDEKRFVEIVEEGRSMLQKNPEKPGLAITIESLMTTSTSQLTRAAAVAILQSSADTNREKLVYALDKAFQHEKSGLVRQFIEAAIAGKPITNSAPVAP